MVVAYILECNLFKGANNKQHRGRLPKITYHNPSETKWVQVLDYMDNLIANISWMRALRFDPEKKRYLLENSAVSPVKSARNVVRTALAVADFRSE